MGNGFSTRDERDTQPQGIYNPKNAEYRKLKWLIPKCQLAPCFPGADECTPELDECPICFLSYPSLNRSTCCSKAICTDCYLQIKSAHPTQSPQCPFCKTSNYTAKYYGPRTAEEKSAEQAEEQKVKEAQIRIRQKELCEEAGCVCRFADDTWAAHMQRSLLGLHRLEGVNPDMEDMMPISLSIQEQNPTDQNFDPARQMLTLGCTRYAGRTRRATEHAAFVERHASNQEDHAVNSTQNLQEQHATPGGKRQNGKQNRRKACRGSEKLNGSWLENPKRYSGLSSVQREGEDLIFELELDQSSSEAVEASTSVSCNVPYLESNESSSEAVAASASVSYSI